MCSRWLLRADPEAALGMLVNVQPPLAPEVVLPVLRGVSPTLCAPYLEAALAANVAPRKTYDTELGVMYLQLLLEESPPGAAGVGYQMIGFWRTPKSWRRPRLATPSWVSRIAAALRRAARQLRQG